MKTTDALAFIRKVDCQCISTANATLVFGVNVTLIDFKCHSANRAMVEFRLHSHLVYQRLAWKITLRFGGIGTRDEARLG